MQNSAGGKSGFEMEQQKTHDSAHMEDFPDSLFSIREWRMTCYNHRMPRPKSNPQLVLRPQDVVVLLRLSIKSQPILGYARLAEELKLTASEIHAAVDRAVAAQLVVKNEAGKPSVLMAPFRLFVQHGLRYCFPATRGQMTRGMVTSYAAPAMASKIVQPNEPPPVWPDKAGKVRGATFYPLYPTVPEAALGNPELYDLLSLVDCIRGGSTRERALAITELDKRWADSNSI